MRKIAAILALCICGALIYKIASQKDSDFPLKASDAFEQGICSQDAVLLSQDVLIALELTQAPTVELKAGRALYLCDEIDGSRRVIFPQDGSPADCTMRSQNASCTVGFIKMPFGTMVLG